MERSILGEEHVKKLMEKYDLSSYSALPARDVLAINPPPKHILIYEHTLFEGLSFPLSSFVSSTLAQLCVYPGQLVQNGVRVLIGFELLCFYHNMPPNPNHFFHLYRPTRLRDHFGFHPRPGSPRVHFNLSNNCKKWNDQFFFLKYDMGTYPEKPLINENWGKYQLDREQPDVHAKFQVSRVMDLSNAWDYVFIRDYLKLAQESVFTDYTWPSESDRFRALNDWKKAFERRSLSRKEYEMIGAKVVDNTTDRRVGESVGQTKAQEESSTDGEVEFIEDGNYVCSMKRPISEVTLEQPAEEPALARAKMRSCSIISNHDVEGDNVLGQMPSGGEAGTSKTPIGRNCFSQNPPVVGEGPPVNTISLAADMKKITSRFLSSVTEYEETIAKLKDALDAKTAQCQTWEDKFNMSQKEHACILLKQEEEAEHKLKKCLKERALEREEYEKLLKDQHSVCKLLKEQNEALDAAMNKVKAYFLNGLSDIQKARSLQRK